eukprot:1159880-Pelagomonas_calceolata.AAC.1
MDKVPGCEQNWSSWGRVSLGWLFMGEVGQQEEGSSSVSQQDTLLHHVSKSHHHMPLTSSCMQQTNRGDWHEACTPVLKSPSSLVHTRLLPWLRECQLSSGLLSLAHVNRSQPAIPISELQQNILCTDV